MLLQIPTDLVKRLCCFCHEQTLTGRGPFPWIHKRPGYLSPLHLCTLLTEVLGFALPNVSAERWGHRGVQTGPEEAACALWTRLLLFSVVLSLSVPLITPSCLPNPPISAHPPTLRPFYSVSTARVCDNAMLRCQNGGTCHHHQRCHCSPGFTGVLCERARCQGAGECDDQLSGQATLYQPLVSCHLSLALIVLLLLTFTLCWGTGRAWHPQPHPRSSTLTPEDTERKDTWTNNSSLA